MSYKKICLTFTIILFVSSLVFVNTINWRNDTPFSFFNGTETLCINNKITVKYASLAEYGEVKGLFNYYDGRNYIWSTNGEKIEPNQLYNYNYSIHEANNQLKGKTLSGSVEFLFINKVETLKNLFNAENDALCENIEEIDFNWFDYSEVSSFENAFKGLKNLKSIKFKNKWKRCDAKKSPKYNRPKPIVITSMLEGCVKLESVDLSIFDTSQVEDMSSLLKGCTELKALDLAYFYFKEDTVIQDMLSGVEKLKYISLYNIDGAKEKITDLVAANINNLILCQGEKLFTHNNELCCEMEVLENGEITCKGSSNFIVLYYRQDCNYENGFQRKSNYRNSKYLIFYKGEFIKSSNQISITENDGGLQVIIYFYYSQTSLEKFFDINEDSNMQYVESMDLSNFDASETVNMNSMFYGLSSLKSLNLSGLDLSTVTDMNSMFYGLSSISTIDLRNSKTINVTNMSNLFYNCTNLTVLYISEFNILTNTVTENMFYNVNNLKYLGIDNIEDVNKIITDSPLNSINDLIVCQSEKLIENSGARNICCSSYVMEKELCISDNYIIVTFNESSNFVYDSGFKVGSEFRKRISFIMKDNIMIGPE